MGRMMFQSTPANFTAGDLEIAPRQLCILEFQSTPANFTAGDRRGGVFTSRDEVFQSTPANFTAGDAQRRCPAAARRPVSIHARQFHSGRPEGWRVQICPETKFQSTPANFTAGDQGRAGAARCRAAVSIHARQFHSGRPGAGPPPSGVSMFQSTPANFTAGDRRSRPTTCGRCGFNPRPPISQRATAVRS